MNVLTRVATNQFVLYKVEKCALHIDTRHAHRHTGCAHKLCVSGTVQMGTQHIGFHIVGSIAVTQTIDATPPTVELCGHAKKTLNTNCVWMRLR